MLWHAIYFDWSQGITIQMNWIWSNNHCGPWGEVSGRWTKCISIYTSVFLPVRDPSFMISWVWYFVSHTCSILIDDAEHYSPLWLYSNSIDSTYSFRIRDRSGSGWSLRSLICIHWSCFGSSMMQYHMASLLKSGSTKKMYGPVQQPQCFSVSQ